MLLVTPEEQGPLTPSRSTTSVAGAATAREAKRATKVVNCILKDFVWSPVILSVFEACDGDDGREKSNLKVDTGPLFMLRKVGSASRVSHERLFCLVETSHCHRLDSQHVGRFSWLSGPHRLPLLWILMWDLLASFHRFFRPVICDTRTKNYPVGEKPLS